MFKTRVRPAPHPGFGGWCLSGGCKVTIVASSQKEAEELQAFARSRGDVPANVLGQRNVTRMFVEGRVCYGNLPPEIAVFARCIVGRDGQEYVVKKKE